ncbi:TPA: hypothetical protein ACGS08_002841 [Pseudomonas aeruginosa]|uniref:hypothetical protein n=1 Tax=Pseudomonas aeruginosa TaxID=287 RepID=UPI003727C812
MPDKSHAHELITWTKQRLDDLDTIIAETEKAIETLKDNARQEAQHSAARLREARMKLREYSHDLQAEADIAKHRIDAIKAEIEKEWIEVESSFQTVLFSARDQAGSVHDIVCARARAQHQSWETSTKKWRDQATDAMEKAQGEFNAAMQRLSEKAEHFQNRIGEVKDASDESWKAVKEGLADAKDIHERTIRKIRETLSKPNAGDRE